jgi:hypothetical protein
MDASPPPSKASGPPSYGAAPAGQQEPEAEEEEEGRGDSGHLISNTDTIIHLLKVTRWPRH